MGDGKIEADELAFYYMTAIFISIFLLPATFVFLKNRYYKKTEEKSNDKVAGDPVNYTGSDSEAKPARKVKIESPSWIGTAIKAILLIFFWYILFEILFIIWDVSLDEYATFDPWTTLGVSTFATDKEIKSAYRKMSLLYHPDKNINNPEAKDKFLEVAKAYNILTDEKARDNYEKYGNPDGPRRLKIGLGMPDWLMKPEYHSTILIVFFLFMLVVIPGWAFYFTRNTDPRQRIEADLPYIYTVLNENLNIKQCPQLLAGCKEIYAPLPLRPTDGEELNMLGNELQDMFPRMKMELPPKVMKAMIIIFAHMNKYEISPELTEDLEHILSNADDILEQIIEMSYKMGLQARMKNVGLRSMCLLVEFSAMLRQGLYLNENPLFQIPYVNETNFKEYFPDARTKLSTVLSGKLGLLETNLSTTQLQDVHAAIDVMPRFIAKARVATEVEKNNWDENVCLGDLTTICLNIERQNIPEGRSSGYCCALNCPFKTKDAIWVLIAERESNKVLFCKKITNSNRKFEDTSMKILVGKENNVIAMRAGKYTWDVHIKSDSYVGLDVLTPLVFTVKRMRKDADN